jgi:anti-anti-sigma regulatory factor
VLLTALDLVVVRAIDLDGIGALARESDKRGKRLVILAPNPSVESRLRMLGYLTSGRAP